MMNDTAWLSRSELLLGREKLERLFGAHVLVVGMGGVGSFAAEFICRSGVGSMTLVDGDVVEASNRNRQLPALVSTQGQNKAVLMAARLKDINPEIELNVIQEFIRPEAVANILSTKFDYVVDAIDSVSPKLTFIKAAFEKQYPLVSSMGAGGKMDPTKIEIADISKSYNCPFAQQVRKQLKKEGIYKGFKVVFSPEENNKESLMMTDGSNFKKSAYGTMSYLPAMFGATAASVVIRDLTNSNS